MVTNIKISVLVSDLIVKAEAALSKQLTAHKAAIEKYEVDAAKWKEKATSALQSALDKAESRGYLPDTIGGGYRDRGEYLKVGVPSRPSKPTLSVDRLERDIAFLKAAQETTLTLTTEHDLARYL